MSLGSIVAAQIADYPRVHRAEANLAIHLMAVPMFWAGLMALAIGAAALSWLAAAAGAVLLLASVALQGWGHGQEKERAAPFPGPLNFLIRITTENLYVFPRYVLTGGWLKAWRAQRR
jgi:hypothetical protein